MPVRSPALSFAVLATLEFDEDDFGSWLPGRLGASAAKQKAATNGRDGKAQTNGNASGARVGPLVGYVSQKEVVLPVAQVNNSNTSSRPVFVANGTQVKSAAANGTLAAAVETALTDGAREKKRKKRNRHRSRRSSMAEHLGTNVSSGAASMAGSLDLSHRSTLTASTASSVDTATLSSCAPSLSAGGADQEELEAVFVSSHQASPLSSSVSKTSSENTTVDEEGAPCLSLTADARNDLTCWKMDADGMLEARDDVEEVTSRDVSSECQVGKLLRTVASAGALDTPMEQRSLDASRHDSTGGEERMEKAFEGASHDLRGAQRCDDDVGEAAGVVDYNCNHPHAGGDLLSVAHKLIAESVQIREEDRADRFAAGFARDGAVGEGGGGGGEQQLEDQGEKGSRVAVSTVELSTGARQSCAPGDSAGRFARIDRESSLLVEKKSSIVSSCRVEVKALQGLRTGELTPTTGVCTSPRRRAGGNSREGTPRAGSRSVEDALLEDSLVAQAMAMSPSQFLLDEIMGGSALRSTASPNGNMKRERVYNTMFHVPWRVELLIDIGFLVCLDAFLYLFTVMPLRIFFFLWRRLRLRWPQRPHPDEICDIVSLIVLVLGVYCLHQADISFIYHWIRGQAIIKLYVVFNVLEIIDKLCQSFGGDVMQMLFNTAAGVAHCDTDRLWFESLRLAFDLCIAIVCYLLHSLIILSQAVTLNVAINSHSNALLTLLISNNFMEIKSNVFKRLGRENLHKMAYLDTVERFHITAHIIFVIVQNVFVAEEPWLWDLASNAGMILLCEVLVDAIKHAFLAKFNDIKPRVYGEFLQSLCRQTLHSQSRHVHKTLTFVPLAPACVVARVMGALFYEFMPNSPGWWKWTSRSLGLCAIFILLLVLKIVLALGLQWHARWYLWATKRDAHLHAD